MAMEVANTGVVQRAMIIYSSGDTSKTLQVNTVPSNSYIESAWQIDKTRTHDNTQRAAIPPDQCSHANVTVAVFV
jgi:hypothetical protein